MWALEVAVSIRVSVGVWKITLIQCLENCLGVRTPEFIPGVPGCLVALASSFPSALLLPTTIRKQILHFL